MNTSKSLNTIQTVVKICKVLAKIAFIFCTIGAVGCLIGLISLPFGQGPIFQIGGTTIYGPLGDTSALFNNGTAVAAMLSGLIVTASEAYLAKCAERFFAHELETGTPFTQKIADEMKVLGIKLACVSLGAFILSVMSSCVVQVFMENAETADLELSHSFTIGIMMLALSVLCKYGAELAEKNAEQDNQ